jgi:nucleotide-binding universal stress UspA family protein
MLSANEALLLVVLWVAAGVLGTVFFHARAGRRSGLWYVISIILGPFSLPIGWEMSRDRHIELVERRPGRQRPGIRVLAALDGSEEAENALREALDVVGARVGSLVLVHVLDYDEATMEREQAVARGEALLTRVSQTLSDDLPEPAMEVAVGPPADVLIELATRESADLLVVGHRGTGLSRAVLGSVSNAVARHSPVPVMLGADPRAVAR